MMYMSDEINFHNVSVRIVSLLSLEASKCDPDANEYMKVIYLNCGERYGFVIIAVTLTT